MRRILTTLFHIIPKNIYENCIRQNLIFMPRFLAMAKYGSTEGNAAARMELWVENDTTYEYNVRVNHIQIQWLLHTCIYSKVILTSKEFNFVNDDGLFSHSENKKSAIICVMQWLNSIQFENFLHTFIFGMLLVPTCVHVLLRWSLLNGILKIYLVILTETHINGKFIFSNVCKRGCSV